MYRTLTVRKRLTTVFAVLGLSLIGALAPMSAAQAQVGDLDCALNFQFDFSPGLSLGNPQGIPVITANFTSCVSPNQRFSNLTAATVLATGVANVSGYPLNPCALLLEITGTGTFAWSNGQNSPFTWEVTTDPLKNLLTLHADITSGPMAGDTGTAVPIVPIVNADCAIAGLRTLGAVGVISFNRQLQPDGWWTHHPSGRSSFTAAGTRSANSPKWTRR